MQGCRIRVGGDNGAGGRGAHASPPDFDRSFNPISQSGEADYAHHITNYPTPHRIFRLSYGPEYACVPVGTH